MNKDIVHAQFSQPGEKFIQFPDYEKKRYKPVVNANEFNRKMVKTT